MVLFGGTVLCGGDILAQAIQNKVAKKYIIVGGIGHTTSLKIKELFPEINIQNFENLSEAEIFSNYVEFYFFIFFKNFIKNIFLKPIYSLQIWEIIHRTNEN